jgi:hypothetical protein
MNGVEILSSAEVASEFAFNWTVFWIVFAAVASVCTFVSILEVVTGECEWLIIPIILFVGVIGGIIIGAAFGDIAGTPTAYETHYKVTIDDSVSMNEFLDKYEILDQEGKIYTVKERNND